MKGQPGSRDAAHGRPPSSSQRVPRARTPRGARPGLGITLLLGLLPAVFVLIIPAPILRQAEWAAYDWRIRFRNAVAPKPIAETIILAGINEDDNRVLSREIASREVFPALLSTLRDWGAEVVIFDIFFQRTTDWDDLIALQMRELPTILAYRVDTFQPAPLPAGEPPPDFEGMDTLSSSNDLAELEKLFSTDLPAYEKRLTDLREEALLRGRPLPPEEDLERARLLAWTRHYERVLAERWMELKFGKHYEATPGARPVAAQAPILISPPLLRAAKGLGIANINKEEESVVRRAPLLFLYHETLYPSLDLAAVCWYYGVDFRDTDISWGREITIHPEQNASLPVHIPIDNQGQYLINYREGESYLRRPANPNMLLATAPEYTDEAARRGIPGAVRDSIVFAGELVSGGRDTDVEPVPIQAAFPMVAMHVNVVDNILKGDFMREVRAPAAGAILLGFGAVLGLLFHLLPFKRAAGASIALVGLYIAVTLVLFNSANMILPAARFGVSSVTAVICLFAYVVGVTERDRRTVKEIFMRSVSPRIGEEILRNYDDESLWGSRRELTVLFVDIREFTAMTEQQDVDRVLGVLDFFYDTVSGIVFKHEGQVNKLLGDAVLALFGSLPEESGNHAERAVRAAVEIQKQLGARAEAVATGAGIESGEAVAGIVGQRRTRIEFTAIGDPVNTASRIQGLASRNEIVLGPGTVAQLGEGMGLLLEELECAVETVAGVRVKGKAEELTVTKLRLRRHASES
ncbi:adenylate/guanylate cyclase domain-containing protein [Candidatus Poribacteria bacterium]|nr:adenylate/guanylate cyclase domain-containing protein [Candidatus Poribacteria bacterium]